MKLASILLVATTVLALTLPKTPLDRKSGCKGPGELCTLYSPIPRDVNNALSPARIEPKRHVAASADTKRADMSEGELATRQEGVGGGYDVAWEAGPSQISQGRGKPDGGNEAAGQQLKTSH